MIWKGDTVPMSWGHQESRLDLRCLPSSATGHQGAGVSSELLTRALRHVSMQPSHTSTPSHNFSAISLGKRVWRRP
jgi:hypothetical protein